MAQARLAGGSRPAQPARLDGFFKDDDLRPSQALTAALEADKREGLLLAVRARWAALAVIAVFIVAINWRWDVLYYLALIGLMALIGWAQVKIGRVGRSRLEVGLIFCDLALITLIAVVPNPFLDIAWPPAMQYHMNIFLYFFVLLSAGTMAYTYRTMLAYGMWVTILWIGGIVYVASRPKMFEEVPAAIATVTGDQPMLIPFLDPNNVNLIGRAQELIVFLIVAAILMISGRRTYRLLLRQAEAARERGNLARHFPPSIVDQLAERDQPLGAVREQPVAVLFADIVGFTQYAAERDPDDVVATLRAFHERLERAVFEHGGTLDKFLGDGLMATFGTPDTGPKDAGNAIACAFDMQRAIAEWNQERAARGQAPIRLSVGAHYGSVVLGDIGSARRLEFAVLGDAVNVASRLEKLTRELDVGIALSDELVAAARAQGADEAVAGLAPDGTHRLRGRETEVKVWTERNA